MPVLSYWLFLKTQKLQKSKVELPGAELNIYCIPISPECDKCSLNKSSYY